MHISLGQTLVTGVEFGMTFMMLNQVSDYLSRLGYMPRLNRYLFNTSTLYYKGTGRKQSKVYAFYDKLAEAKSKGLEYPNDLSDKNLLRFEMRLNGRLAKQLKNNITASTLYDIGFYRMMIKLYQDSYYSISKNHQIKADCMSEIKKVSDAYDMFVARLISQTDQAQISDFLDELKEAGVFSDRKYYSRLRNKIKEVATKANISISDELIKELDDDIKNCGAYV